MFDARTAKLLKPGEHLTIPSAPGLRLVATQTTRSWVYRYKSPVDGRMRQVKIGGWPVMTWQAAVGEWEKLRQARESGADPAAQKRRARVEVAQAQTAQLEVDRIQRYTVADVCADYVTHLQGRRKEKGWREVQRMFGYMLRRDFLVRSAATVGRRDAYELLQTHLASPVMARALRQELAGAWDLGIDAGRLPEETPNWWRQIMRGQLRSKGKQIDGEKQGVIKRVLSEQEVTQLLRWLGNYSRAVEDILTMYLWTGCRGAEICAMEAHEVTEEADGWWWTVPRSKMKTGRLDDTVEHRVPLVGRALALVQRRMSIYPAGYLFPSDSKEGGCFRQKSVNVSVYVHQPYSKVKPWRETPRGPVSHWAPHDLRRTMRTMLAAMGCPDAVGEAILAHKPPGVMGVYNLHTYDAEKRVWLAALDVRLEQLARPDAH
jgi:integrase